MYTINIKYIIMKRRQTQQSLKAPKDKIKQQQHITQLQKHSSRRFNQHSSKQESILFLIISLQATGCISSGCLITNASIYNLRSLHSHTVCSANDILVYIIYCSG